MSDSDGFDVRSLAITLRRGTDIRDHTHRWGQLVFASAGSLRVSTENASWLIPPSCAIWVPGGFAHRISVPAEDAALRTLYVAPERARPFPLEPVVIEVIPLLRELILHVVDLGMLAEGRTLHDHLATLLVDLCLQARRESVRLPLPADPRARRLAEHLQAGPADERPLTELAAAVGASLRTLQRCFARETGLSLEAWRLRARLIHGASRLSAGTSVTAAAIDCGYRSVTAFGAAFRREFGVTPGQYAGRAGHGTGPHPKATKLGAPAATCRAEASTDPAASR